MSCNIVSSFICLSESKCIVKLINFADTIYDTVIFKICFFQGKSFLASFIDIAEISFALLLERQQRRYRFVLFLFFFFILFYFFFLFFSIAKDIRRTCYSSRAVFGFLFSFDLAIAGTAASRRWSHSIWSEESTIHLHSVSATLFSASASFPFPVERIVSIATTFPHLPSFLSFFHGAINFSSSPFPLLLPGEEGPRSMARDPSHGV